MGFNERRARLAQKSTVSIPNRELVGFQPTKPLDLRLLVRQVSIPNRELVGFQPQECQGFQRSPTVSIPNRELVGFQQEVNFCKKLIVEVSIPNRELVGFQLLSFTYAHLAHISRFNP